MNVAEIIGWKFNHAEGMSTRNNVITEWPNSLGSKPVHADLKAWEIEMENDIASKKEAKDVVMTGKLNGIKTKLKLNDADIQDIADLVAERLK